MLKSWLIIRSIVSLGFFIALLWAAYGCKGQSAKPNVVFILADDLGYGDLASYGHKQIKTPNLDALATQGILLTNFYSPSPLCSPARAGFLTGRTPFRTGIKSWIPEGENIYLRKEETTIPSLLRKNGYQTCLSGKWHLNGGLNDKNHSQPQDHGFDYWLANHAFAIPNHKNPENFYRNGEALGRLEGFSAQIVVDEALDWIEDRDQSRPFFLYLSFNEPHSEIASPDEFNEMYSDYTEGEIDLESLSNRGPGEYYANITHLDHQVGRFLDRLDELDLAHNTLLIFTSDNGPVTTEWRYPWEVNMYGSTGGLRGRKADLYDGGIRVPCFIRYPGVVSPGIQSNVPLHGYDLLPTISKILGIDLPQANSIDGVDFSPIFSGGAVNRPNPLFWAYEIRAYDDPAGYYFAVRDGDWKFITDQAIQKTLLYNLKDDPYELKELSAQHSDRIEEMKAFVSEMYQSIQQDPLRPD